MAQLRGAGQNSVQLQAEDRRLPAKRNPAKLGRLAHAGEDMTRGRKPKPTALKLIEGNPGKRAMNDAEPNAGPIGEPPEDLDGIALAKWREMDFTPSFTSSLWSSASMIVDLRTTRSRPVLLLATSRPAFITVNLSAMDATIPSVKDAFARCRS